MISSLFSLKQIILCSLMINHVYFKRLGVTDRNLEISDNAQKVSRGNHVVHASIYGIVLVNYSRILLVR